MLNSHPSTLSNLCILFLATCRCNPIMKALWSPVPPYAALSPSSNPTGLIPQLLSDMVSYSCGQCSEHDGSRIIYQLDSQTFFRGIRDTEMDRDKVDFIFPVRQSKDRQTAINGEYYIPLLEVPGFAFLTSVKTEMAYARQVASSVLNCWPIVAISLSMTFVSGFFLWILVSCLICTSKDNREKRLLMRPFQLTFQEVVFYNYTKPSLVYFCGTKILCIKKSFFFFKVFLYFVLRKQLQTAVDYLLISTKGCPKRYGGHSSP